MESKDKIFCKNCGNKVHYSRDTREFCDDACKDRYYYSIRRIEKKRARYTEQIKADPNANTMLYEEVEARLKELNDPILQAIERVENNIRQYNLHIPPQQVKVAGLREEVAKLEALQKEYDEFNSYGPALEKWIDKEKDALADKSMFGNMDRFSKLRNKESELNKWKMDHTMSKEKQKQLQQDIINKKQALALEQKQLDDWEEELLTNKQWLLKTYLEQNLKRVDDLKILPLPRPAKRKKSATKKGEVVSKPFKSSKSSTGVTTLGGHKLSAEGQTTSQNTFAPPAADTQSSKGIGFFLGLDLLGRPLYWHPLGQSNPHGLAIGKSGSGKTTFIGICLYEAHRQGLPLLAFDYDGGLLDKRLCNKDGIPISDLIGAKVIDAAAGLGVNPLSLPQGVEHKEKQNPKLTDYQTNAEGLSESLATIFGLGDVQKGLLLEAIEEAYRQKGYSLHTRASDHLPAPTLKDVWNLLQEKKGEKEYSHLLLRLKPLLSKNLFDSEGSLAIEELFRGNSFIDLSGLSGDEGKAAIARLLLGKIYEHMLFLGPSKEEQIRLLIIIDEAHFLTKDVWVEKLITVARKFGVLLLLASHSGKDFSEKSFNTVGTKIALRMEGSDAKRMADNMGVVERKEKKPLEERILNQEKLHGVIRNDEHSPYTFFKLTPLFERE